MPPPPRRAAATGAGAALPGCAAPARRPRARRRPSLRAAAPGGGAALDAEFAAAAAPLRALDEYAALLARPDAAWRPSDLPRAAALAAAAERPGGGGAEPQDVVDELDDLAEQVAGAVAAAVPPAERYPLRVLRAVSGYLYGARGFRGAEPGEYYDPDNARLDAVLRRRVGIPVSLSLVHAHCAAAAGVPLVGVNMPGHFLLTPADPDLRFFVDAFERGAVAFESDAEVTLSRIYRMGVTLDRRWLDAKAPLPPRAWLARLLNNLKAVHKARGDDAGALAATRLLRATTGAPGEARDEGILLARLGRRREARAVLRGFLDGAPADSEDAARVRRVLRSLEGEGDGGAG